VKAFVIKIQRSGVWWTLMRQCLPSLLPMQLGILQISLNSSAIRSHSSKVETVIHIRCTDFQMAFPDSSTMPCTVFFPTRKKSYPKTQMIPQWQDTWNRLSFSDSQKCKGGVTRESKLSRVPSRASSDDV
jgi:hypothetical protein